MNEDSKRSILQMARGAIQERTDYEMGRILDNIQDANTPATATRELVVTIKLKPDADRKVVGVECVAKSKLAPTNPVVTSLYMAGEDNVVEMVPQVPGQFGLDGTEQEAPPTLKIIKFA